MYRFLLLFSIFFVITRSINAQITALGHSREDTAWYATDTLVKIDTLYASTVYFRKHTAYIDSISGKQYTLVSDTIYRNDSAFYTLKTIYSTINRDTIYYFKANDTVVIRFYEFFFEHRIYSYFITDTSARRSGILTAKYSPSDGGLWDFVWSKYNPETDLFVDFQTNSGVNSSVADSLATGGYRVSITNGITDTVYYAWVFNYYLNVTLGPMKNFAGEVKSGFYTCEYLKFDGTITVDTMYYYSVYTHLPDTLENKVTMAWTSKPSTEIRKPPQWKKLNPDTRSYDLKAEDTDYTLTIDDSFGRSLSDNVRYISIQTEALFDLYFKDGKADKEERDWEKSESPKGSAPLKTIFVSTSKNSAWVEWFISDSADFTIYKSLPIGETPVKYDTSHIFYIPKTYAVKMVSHSDENCTDTIALEEGIVVEKSELNIPNVFSPNGDGFYDVFKPEKEMSIRKIEVIIFSPWGDEVYYYKGDMSQWEGWDGRIRNSEKVASPGMYFYIIKAAGWESDPQVKYTGTEYAGYIYLFR